MKLIRILILISFCFSSWIPLHADELEKADAAVAHTLLEYDGSIDLIFASNTPDDLYEDILTKLQNHPDITSILASKGGPACKAF